MSILFFNAIPIRKVCFFFATACLINLNGQLFSSMLSLLTVDFPNTERPLQFTKQLQQGKKYQNS